MGSVIAIIAIVITFIGILVAVGLSLRSRKERIPIWFYRTTKVIDGGTNSKGDISIYFRGQPVPRVAVTKLGLINLGKDSILNSYVIEPIIISFGDEVSILKEPVVGPSRGGIHFSATHEEKTVKLFFEFLDHLDGALVEITHTGDENSKIQLEGTIIGVPKGITQRSHEYALKRKKRHWIFKLLVFGTYTIFLLWALILGTIADMSRGKIDIEFTVGFSLLTGVAIFLLVYTLIHWKRSLPNWLRIED